jgi:hypothetical protein
MSLEEGVCCCEEDLEPLELEDNENKSVRHYIIPFEINGIEVDIFCKTVLKRDKETGKQYRQETLVVPGTLYGLTRDTILNYSTRNDEHLTVLNKGRLHGNAINSLSDKMYGIKQDRTISTKHT